MAATVGGKNSNERIETGWQRLKSVCMPRYGSGVPEELHDLPSSVIVASTVGFLAGGLYGTRTAADKFIAFNHFSKFTSTMQAQREMHAASMMGFLGTGCRWGWQLGAFAGLFTAARLLASIYRDRDDVINYVAAGSLTGGLFRVKYGLRATVGGAFVGTLVSLPLGAFMQGMEWLLIRGEQKETMALRRRTQRRRREEQWEERLKATDLIIEDLNNEDTHEFSKMADLQDSGNDDMVGEALDDTPPTATNKKVLVSTASQTGEEFTMQLALKEGLHVMVSIVSVLTLCSMVWLAFSK